MFVYSILIHLPSLVTTNSFLVQEMVDGTSVKSHTKR
jgi:hypothetical protein